MTAAAALVRFARLSWRNRLLLAEATAAVAVTSAAIRILPFRRSVALGARTLNGAARVDVEAARPICWSVRRAAAAVPWKAVCFPQGLALQWMLRRRGFDARLHYGAATRADDGLKAHVWIEVGGEILIGAGEAPNYRSVAVFPPGP